MRKNFILQYGPKCIRKKADLQVALDYLKQSNPIVEFLRFKTRVIDLLSHQIPDYDKLDEDLARYS